MRIVIKIQLVAMLLFVMAGTSMAETKLPFGPGEKLTYEIHWAFVHAGNAVLEVMPDTEMNGVPARHFKATAKTVPWVDKIYKVRDTIESWTDMDVTHSLHYKKDQNEGSYHKKEEVKFNNAAGLSYRWSRGKLKEILKQPDDVFDSMAILFNFRKAELYRSLEYAANVSDGKVTVVGKGYVVKEENIETAMGTMRAFRVNLDVSELSGVFKKSKDAELVVWLSADERRLPLKVRSKVVVGHFTLELVDYQPPKGVQK